MAIESKNLLVWVKAMSRGQALPLDASEIYGSLAEAQDYASSSAIAYEGQTIKAKTADGKYHSYVLQPSEAGYVLEEVGAIKQSDLKQYVMVVESLPESGQEQGILYICNDSGSIWTGSAWREVFHDVQADLDEFGERIDSIEATIEEKAPLSNPIFSGVIKVGEDEVALKSYVDGLFANLEDSCAVPGIVSSENPLPDDYKAGQTYRVAEDGEYAGIKCEAGDLILIIKDSSGTASSGDFMVLQANIDGAVTSVSDVVTVGELVVFDSVTGRIIKGAGIQVSSLSDAIEKAHKHDNIDILGSYTKTQDILLDEAKAAAQELVTAHETAVNEALAKKADAADTLEGYGITDAYTQAQVDSKLSVINENLNTKISASDVDEKISDAKEEILSSAASDAKEKLEARVGSIPADTTIQSYIDTAVGSGGTASASAIAKAKQEAIDTSKEYTDTQLLAALTVTEF